MAAALAGATLGVWLVRPGLLPAALALVAALATGIAAGRARRRAGMLLAVVAGIAGTLAAGTSWRVRAVETDWPNQREQLVEDAQRRLDATLGEAVTLARALAEEGQATAGLDPRRAFDRLEDGVGSPAPERGVAVLDGAGRAVSWAGRHRVAPELPRDELFATITPFYVVLRAQRQAGEWRSLGDVLLAADGAVPDGEHSVAARFAAGTGVGLEFYVSRRAPPIWTDVFDYCIPSCRDTLPDTLFSVRAVPPTQGEEKLRLLDAGERRVGLGAVVVFALLAVTAAVPGRYLGVAGLAALLLLTRVGEAVGLADVFSPASYFWSVLGPLSSSAGAVFVTAGLLAMATVGLWRSTFRRGPAVRALGFTLAAGTPYLLTEVAGGITPPTGGVPAGLWISWQICVTMASAALVLLAAALARGADHRAGPAWVPWAAVVWAAALGVLGLLIWLPGGGWPSWYVFLWVPAFLLAVQPGRTVRTIVATAVVAGSAAALLTWGATIEGRLMLAERDAGRLTAPDPIAAGLLERFGDQLQAERLPASAAMLYRLWRRSPLSRDDYPALLATWDPEGRMLARLDLADLDLPVPLLHQLARSVGGEERPVMSELERVPGIHYVLSIPYPDGSVVTVGIGPRSRALPPVRVARFLRGERLVDPPYDLVLAEPAAPARAGAAERWRRDGWVVRGERLLDSPGGARQVYVTVALGEFWPLVIRGVLVTALDIALVALLWLGADALAGRVRLWPGGLVVRRLRSYRTRLTLALAVFFVAPTVGFTAWSVSRLEAEAERSGTLLTQQTLRDAGQAARQGGAAVNPRELSARFGADLLLYDAGTLVATSVPVLDELGLLDRYLPAEVHRHLVLEGDLEITAEDVIGGRRTRVGYRNLGTIQGRPMVLSAPRLVDDAQLFREQQDLAYALLLATLVGLGASVLLAGVAAKWLARPVHALRAAAEAIGQGKPLPPLGPAVPVEFVPVVEGLERMARDVRTSQAELEASRQRTAAVLRSVATGVVALDAESRVMIANPRAEEMLGAGLTPGVPVREVTPAAWSPLWVWAEQFLRGGGEGEPEPHELVVGERRIRAQIADLGENAGCVVALDDTTDLAHAVRVLAWGELARQIAHEVKNPLTPIRLGIQHLERAYRDRREGFDATLERTSRQILAEIERLDAIARAFARFGAPPAEAGPLAREDLAGVARETAQLYALGADTSVRVEAAGPVFGLVRRDELKEVLVNLIENARNGGARGVVVRVEPVAGGGAGLSVQDDGHGIAAEHLPRIFEPHFSTTTSGTGLGLAICRRLVESWGGTIAVESRPSEGTVVTVHTAA